MALNAGELATSIVTAMKAVFNQQWPQIKDYAESEAKKLGESLVQIELLSISGQITEGEASILLEMHKNATRAVLLSIEGMGLLLVEAAINAAMAAVKEAVNGALGFAIL